MAGEAGFLYEGKIHRKLKAAGLVPNGFTPAGSDANAPDAMFIYNKANLQMTKSFPYFDSKEGWGLCNDGNKLYKSDGSENIWILNPTDFSEEKRIQVVTNKSALKKINELEWVSGKIYANTYQFQKDVVVIINPKTGRVEGVVDFSGLKEKVKQHDKLNVLNGIAYHKSRKTFFVTGKNWNKMFEVKILSKF